MIQSTSINAYHAVEDSGLLSGLRLKIIKTLATHGPMTQGECWAYHHSEYQRHAVAPRFAELVKMGVVEQDGERPCGFTGINSLVWKYNNKLPRPYIDPPSREELIRALCKQHEEIIAHLSTRAELKPRWVVWLSRTKDLIKQCEKYRRKLNDLQS